MKDLSWISELSEEYQQAIFDGPAMAPPEGMTSNYDNPPNNNHLGMVLILTVVSLGTVLVSLRIYSRLRFYKKLVLADLCGLAALGCCAGMVYCMWRSIKHTGFQVHQWDVRLRDIFDIAYYINTASILFGCGIMFLKVGILLEMVKIFVPDGVRNWFWWICYVVLVVNVGLYTSSVIVEIFACTPRRKIWELYLPGTCVDLPTVNLVSAIVNFISDVAILVLPQRMIWKLHMPTWKKLRVAPLFAIGIFACICAGIRVDSSVSYKYDEDALYYASDMALWCMGEFGSGFFVLCLPAIPKLFTESALVKKIVSSFRTVPSTSGKTSEKPSTLSFRRRKPRNRDDSLFTDTTHSEFIPHADESVRSDHTVTNHVVDARQQV